ncbi:MAG: hypothetical protein IKP27_02585 [Paludibacteraceae bacterium]|nr:hypothetical protein [Paludibacteraceae bacterium]
MMNSSYRPRNPGHDYYGKGVYLITLVVRGREPLLASFTSEGGCEKLIPTALGEELLLFWGQTAERQAAHGNRVVTHACVCMPDHFHGVIEVLEPMQWNLGDIMQAFKAACTSRWWQMQGIPSAINRTLTDICRSPTTPSWLRTKAQKYRNESELIRNLSKYRRQEYYALVGRERRPLFDDNYDDTVCIDERHRAAMIAYVQDNPRRALLRRAMPDVMRRCLHVRLAGHSYGAFGNLFLLRWARRIQVQCHRKHPTTEQPYEETADYARQHDRWVAAILEGSTVIVTPGISRGELQMKNECLEKGYPLIHIQKEPITPYWKPERQRFDACANGSLLILAPWGLDQMPDVDGVPSDSDYSCFHNMNRLAEEICSFMGEAKIIRR